MAGKSSWRSREFTADFLRSNPEQFFTAREIASALIALHPEAAAEKRLASKQNLDGEKLAHQVQAEIGSDRPDLETAHPQLRTTSDRPRRYFWTENPDELFESPSETSNAQTEHDLYPLLEDFLASQRGLIPMRIDEKRSSHSGGAGVNHWLHPDVVAIQDISSKWNASTRVLSNFYRSELVRLWSFEVKKELTRSNVRGHFFQAVSNSSWANFSYLVAVTIDERAKEELEMLSSAHKVGLIRLNVDDPSESMVEIPAEEKPILDWAMINRLAGENADFQAFVQALGTLHQTGDSEVVRKMIAKSEV